MTDDLTLGSLLERALDVPPAPATGRAVDLRVAAAIAAAATPRRQHHRRSLRITAVLAASVAALVLVAAGGTGLLQRFTRDSDGLTLAWERGTPLGTARAAGITVHAPAAYVDGNRIRVFLTGGIGEVRDAVLTADGRRIPGQGNVVFQRVKGETVGVSTWTTPPGLGAKPRLVLTLRGMWVRDPAKDAGPSPDAAFSPGPLDPDTHPSLIDPILALSTYVKGPWTFEGTVPNAGGSSWRGEASATDKGITVTLRELSVSPTMILARLVLSGPGLEDRDGRVVWGARCTLLHDGRTLDMEGGGNVPVGQPVETSRDGGLDDPSGRYTCRIGGVGAAGETYDPVTKTWQDGLWIKGDWRITVDLP